ncbi:MAG: glycosyltransferase, partial [Balneolaceae bacterium]
MVVSVIIPVLNGETFISRTLRALDRQTYPPDSFEVIVVDNGSTDRTRERVAAHIKTPENRSEKTSGKNRAEKTSENSFEKKSPDGSDDPVNGPVDGPVDGSVNSPVDGPADGPDVKLIVNSGPRNPYLSRNLGASEAAGDLLVFLDATCTPDVRWLEEGVRLIEEGADLVGGHIRFTFSPALSLGEWYDSLTFVNIRQYIEESGSTSGGNLFVRREVWEATGPFPETMRSGGDTYWTRNAGRKGYQLRYGEKAAVSYPARGFRAVVRKSCRVGRGHVQAWHREGRSAQSVLAEIITTFSPPSLSGLKRLIGERGTPEMNRYALQLWCISWLCKVSMALGRAGAFFSVYFPDYIPDRFSFYGKSVEKKSVDSEGPERNRPERKNVNSEGPERKSTEIESPERENAERKSMGTSPLRLQKGTIAFLYYTYYPVTGGASVHGYNLARELSRLGYRLLKINGHPDGFTEKRHPAELWRVLRESDLVYVRMDYFPNLRNLAGLAALLSGKKVVVELNSPSDELHLHGRGRLFIRLVDRVASRLLKRADAVIAVSEGVKTYGETALGLTNIHVIENGGEVFSSEDLSPSAAVKQRVEDLRKKYRKLVVWAGTPNQLQSMEWLQQTILGTREK